MASGIKSGFVKYSPSAAPRTSQEDAWKLIANRSVPEKIFELKASLTSLAKVSTVAGPASITELARALRHNVDLIYEWVYSNVDFYCMWGLHKGALGALIDRVGGSFEQSALMVSLLRESGYTANFVKGSIRLTRTEIENLLGTTETDTQHPSETMLTFGNIPFTPTYDGEDLLEYVDFDHVWVQVDIDGTDYVFDPTYKTYDYITGIDLAAATEFDEEDLMAAAEDGATEGDVYWEDINAGNIRTLFSTYGSNLLTYIRENAFDASMEQIIGGRKIQPLSSTPLRQTELPYQTPESSITIWENIPNASRATYQVEFGGIDETFYTDEIYSKRLTISFNAEMEPELKLEGTVVATGTEQDENEFVVATFTITHPFADTSADQTWNQGIYTDPDSLYFLGNTYGPCSQSMVDYHQQILQQNIANGGATTDENVLGESLAVYFFMHNVQGCQIEANIEQIATGAFFRFHFAGLMQYNSYFQGPAFDLAGVLEGTVSRVGDSDSPGNMFALSLYCSAALEGGIIQQTTASAGVSALKMLTRANDLGQKIFNANILTWSLVAGGLVNWDDYLASLSNIIIFQEGGVIIHEDGTTAFDDFTGGGWIVYYFGALADTLTGQIAGGGGATPLSKSQVNTSAKNAPNTLSITPRQEKKSSDPVGLFSGNCYYERTDMTVGSSSYPYALSFSHSYNSHSRFNDGPLGFGWSHNLNNRVSIGSNGLRALGETSPKEGAAAIAHAYALMQLGLNFGPAFINTVKVMIGVISTQWLIDEILTNNAFNMLTDGQASTFIKLVDGTYNPPPGIVGNVTQNIDDTFTFKTPQQLTWNFDIDGNLDTYVDPAGVTVTYTYTSGKLTSVTNGLGRTLTLGYDGDRLDTVSDGNGREISFLVDGSGNLTEFTDAEDKTITYDYALVGQLTQIFLPENPATAFVTNTYDSLGRVMTQTGSNTGTTDFYIAGSRAEEVDPLGNSHIMYFNEVGSVLRDIDALGNETSFERDGLDRVTKVTLPEENSTETSYDENNNVLTTTQVAKPGSGLSDIVQTFTYESTWNKVETFEDGEGNITSYEYDPTQGTLLKITRPEIDSQIPEVNFTYNARGQVETRTDETGIVDKFVYDGTNEELLSSTHDFGMGQLNLETAFDYNDWGDVTSITDPRGNTTTSEFDTERRMTLKTECTPFEFESSWVYDDNGMKTSFSRETGEVDPALQTWQWSYLPNGMTETICDPAGNETNFEYDTVGRLSERIDAENRSWRYQYDAVGRIAVVTDPMGQASETRTYTDNGLLASITDARGNTTNYEYDGFDRLKKRIYPDDTFEGYTYNANNQVLTLTTRAGDVITNTYDVLTRLETRDPASLPLQTMTYDLAGRLERLNTPSSADPTSGDYEWLYDTAGRLLTQKMPDAREVTHELDENGNKTKLIWPDSYYAEYFYDELNRLTDIKLNGSGTAAVHFDYDDLSRRTLVTYENGCTCAYAWEINDDLTDLEHTFDSSSVAWQFGYNKVHQVTSKSVDNADYVWPSPTAFSKKKYGSANNLNQYPSVQGVAQGYDDNGNLTSGVMTATFDVLNRMTQATLGGTTVDFMCLSGGQKFAT
ncbi:MAG: hypothetical protein K2X77_01150 [Candidatus Obscuribacterales bacterium]|nr:hypothetical protein [Candidatus Obscuribacterales bacterium]